MSLSDIADILELAPKPQGNKISQLLSSANKKRKMAVAPTTAKKRKGIDCESLYDARYFDMLFVMFYFHYISSY